MDFDEDGVCLYIRIREGKAARTLEVKEEVLADYDAEGRLVGLESRRRASVPGTMGRKDAPRFELALA